MLTTSNGRSLKTDCGSSVCGAFCTSAFLMTRGVQDFLYAEAIIQFLIVMCDRSVREVWLSEVWVLRAALMYSFYLL